MKTLPQPPRRRAGMRGMGLFDALIALAILAFGMLAMTRFQGRMVAQSTESQSRQQAGQFAAELLSTVLVDVANAACYTLPQTGACGNNGAKTRTADWATRTAAGLPGTVTTTAELNPSGEMGRMRVRITWQGKDSAEPRTLEQVTDVRP